MSYSQLILSGRPLGYWEYPNFGTENILTQNQYSIENSTSGWSAVDSNTSISRVTSDSYVGNASLKLSANSSTSPAAIRISAGSRIEVFPGRRYTMIARVKSLSGNRNASIRIEYFTTQNGSTLSEPVRFSEEFAISSSEWTTIYHTDLIFTPNDNEYFVSWGVSTSATGSVGDEILVDAIQFYEGSSIQLEDISGSNNINYFGSTSLSSKPLAFGTLGSVKLFNNSTLICSNPYKLFISGTENKQASIDFWFAIQKPPSYRHTLISIGSFLKCYVERDRLFIESDGKTASIEVVDWDMQHYVAISYLSRRVDLYLDDRAPVSIILDEGFRFNDAIDSYITPSMVFGPSSAPRNLVLNPSFEQSDIFWSPIDSSLSTTTSDSFSGFNSGLVTKSSNINSGIKQTDRISLEKYQKYQLSAYVKIPTGEESGTLKLVCKTYENITGGSLISTYEDSISASIGWTQLDLSFTPGPIENYVEISIIQSNAGTSGETFLVDSVLLEKSNYPVVWDENSENSDPLFISAIGIYSSAMTRDRILKRISYATQDVSDSLSIKFSGDRIDPQYNSVYSTKEVDITSIAKIDQISSQNLVYTNNGFYMPTVKPSLVEFGLYGGSYDLDSTGISFSGDCHIGIENVDSYFNPYSSTIRLQVQIDSSSGDGTLLSITPIVNNYAICIVKELNKIIGLVLRDFDDTEPQILFESETLVSGEYNIGLNFEELTMSAIVGEEEFIDINIPNIETYTGIFIGNLPSSENAFPDKIRNFCIDPITNFDEIDWYSPGLYMLRFNSNLNVSQKAYLEYVSSELVQSNNSIVTFNDASKPYLLINDEIVYEPSNIPAINYTIPESIKIYAELFTEDAYTDNPKLNNLYASSFNSDFITSSLSNFQIVPNVNGQSVMLNNPYVIKSRATNILGHDSNIGLRFERGVSTGCRVVKTSVNYESFELIFKINKYPNSSEAYNIFDLSGVSGLGLSYSSSGLSKYGTYDLYIDGQLVSSPSSKVIEIGEFYHLFVVLSDSSDSNIHLGNNKSSTNMINGSIGKICVYENTPPSPATFTSDKYQDIIGRISRSIQAGSLSISDEPSASQTYYRSGNGDYFEMLDLPKVKFVASSWEEIDLAN